MTSIERTIYPRFKLPLSTADLQERFTPSPADLALAERYARGPGSSLAFLLLLKTAQALGYFPLLTEVPTELVAHIRWHINVDEHIPLDLPERSRLRYHHLIRTHLGITAKVKQVQGIATTALTAAAKRMDNPADLINAAIEILIKERCQLPAFSTLDRLTGEIRTAVNDRYCTQMLARIPDMSRQVLAALLAAPDGGPSDLTRLKTPPPSATLTHIEEWEQRLTWLRGLGATAEWLADVPVAKVQHWAAEARTLDAAELRDYREARRIILLVSLVHHARISTQDELVKMLIKRLAAIHRSGKDDLDHLLAQERATMEEWMQAFADVSKATRDTKEDVALGATTRTIVARFGDPDTFLTAYEVLAKYHGNNYLPLLPPHYRSHRAVLFRLLHALEIHSTSQDQSVTDAMAYLRRNSGRKVKYLPPDLALDFTTEQWQRTIQIRVAGKVMYDRQRLEICIFSAIASEFKSGDLAIHGSREFADLREQLLPWSACEPVLAEYCQQINLPTTATTFVQRLREELRVLAQQVDQTLDERQATIDANGQLILRRRAAPKPTREVLRLEEALRTKLAERSRTVLEILRNVYYYTGWTHHFGPLSGSDPKVENPVLRYILVAFSEGCNLGPAQTARHLRQVISPHELSYTSRRHVSASRIDLAIRDIINLYHRCDLPFLWGTGRAVAADGTKLELYRDNLLSEYHIRYGGYGGIAYYHVSDQYVALFSHFIACGTWEAVYILDGLLKNTSEITPDTIHADTQGQSTTVFGMAYLLGIQLMPRIRQLKKLVFYRPDADVKYTRIDALFKDTIDWDLIERHWQDVMQVILSIRAGQVLSSSILLKLNNYSRKNRLYQVFRELGRVIRTLFLLRYISDQPLREQITATTNKVESYNEFSQWVAFGNNGKITENDPIEMEKRVKFNQLVCDAIMVQNVLDMTEVMQELIGEGFPVTVEALKRLSPYLHQHIRRYGEWAVDVAEQPPPLTEAMLQGLRTVFGAAITPSPPAGKGAIIPLKEPVPVAG